MIFALTFIQMALAATPAASPSVNSVNKETSSPVESILSEDLIMSLRDPFQLPTSVLVQKETPKTDLEAYPLKDFKLNGVVTGPKKTRAMLTAPSNKTFFVKIGDRVGIKDGKVSSISGEAVRVTEYYVDEHGKRFPDVYELRVSGETVSLSKKEGDE